MGEEIKKLREETNELYVAASADDFADLDAVDVWMAKQNELLDALEVAKENGTLGDILATIEVEETED